jgi:very-short-patch-repair endonuclease
MASPDASQSLSMALRTLSLRKRGARKWKINKGYVIIQSMQDEIKLIARELRKNQTETEKILWDRLINRKFLNKKFLRQHPIVFKIEDTERFFIADFFCDEDKLIIEVDGEIHCKQKQYDQYRDLIVHKLGLRVLRITNKIINSELDYFLAKILTPLLLPTREGAGG